MLGLGARVNDTPPTGSLMPFPGTLGAMIENSTTFFFIGQETCFLIFVVVSFLK